VPFSNSLVLDPYLLLSLLIKMWADDDFYFTSTYTPNTFLFYIIFTN
jgi:hypothetical protein